MTAPVPLFTWILVVGAAIGLVVLLSLGVYRGSTHDAARRAWITAGVLSLWFVGEVVLSAAGVFRGRPGAPPPIGLAVLIPVGIGVLALLFSPRARSFVASIPTPWLVGVQTLRAIGVVFVILEALDLLPGRFAEPAGWGDFAIGITAPWVAYALVREVRGARTIARVWNWLGILDLANAVTVGALSSPSAIRVLHGYPTAAAMARLPLSLVPTFAVPLFLLLHMVSLMRLRSEAAERRGARRAREPVRGGPEAHPA